MAVGFCDPSAVTTIKNGEQQKAHSALFHQFLQNLRQVAEEQRVVPLVFKPPAIGIRDSR